MHSNFIENDNKSHYHHSLSNFGFCVTQLLTIGDQRAGNLENVSVLRAAHRLIKYLVYVS